MKNKYPYPCVHVIELRGGDLLVLSELQEHDPYEWDSLEVQP